MLRPRRSPETLAEELADLVEELSVCGTDLCGGLIIPAGPRWTHVDACLDCYDGTDGCPVPWAHRSCADPLPRLCTHHADRAACVQPVTVLDVPCIAGAAPQECCGCCLDALDLERGWLL